MRTITDQSNRRNPAAQGACPPSGLHGQPAAGPIQICAIGAPHPLLARTLRLAEVTLCATLATSAELVELESSGLPDVFVCCPCRDSDTGMVALVRLASLRRPTVVVGPSQWRHASDVITAGAAAYLVEDSPGVAPWLPSLILAIAAHGRPAPEACTALAKLSKREREALMYISAGYTHSQTARRMGTSKTTVDTFVRRIRMKLGVGNKAELTRVAIAAEGPGDAAPV